MSHKMTWFLTIILMMIMVACAPAVGAPNPVPDDDPAEQIGAQATAAARQALADFLGVSPDSLEMEKIETAEWGDACLGLGGPAELCAAVITPGYAITFRTEGESYIVRTDLDGNQARAEAAAGETSGGDALPPAVEAAQMALAQERGVAMTEITVVTFEQREWSDSCLGLGGPAEICAAVVTPGWEVTLDLNGQPVEVRTDFGGEQVRIADERAGEPPGEIPGPDLNGAIVFYQRSGGLEGKLLTVRIYSDGTIERAFGDPSPDLPVETVTTEPAAVETLMSELQEAGYFDLVRTYLPEDTCCDRMLYLISVQGEDGVHTVEALEAAEGTPEALGQSIELIETWLNQNFSG